MNMSRVQKLKRNMSRAKSKDGVKDKSSSFYLLDFRKRQTSLYRLVYTAIHPLEWMTILGQAFFYSQLVVGAQYAQIETNWYYGSIRDSAIQLHRVPSIQSQSCRKSKSTPQRKDIKTIEGSLIGFTGTDFPQLLFTLYLHLNKMKYTGILINKRIKM